MWVARRGARTRRTGSGLTTSLRRLHPCRRPGGRRRPRQFRAHRQYTGARGHGSTLVGARDTASHERRARPEPVRRHPRLDGRARPPRRRPPSCLDRWVGGDGWVRRALRPRHQRAGRAGDFRPRLRRPAGIAGRHVRADQRVEAAGRDVRRRPSALRDLRRRSRRPRRTDPAPRRGGVRGHRRASPRRRTPARHAAGPLRPRWAGRRTRRRRGRAAPWCRRDRRPDPPAATGRRVAGQPRHRPQPPARGGLALPEVRATARDPAAPRPRLPCPPRLPVPLPPHRPAARGRRPHRHAAARRRAAA